MNAIRKAVGALAAGVTLLVLAGGGIGYRAISTGEGAAVAITASPYAAAAWPLALAALLVSLRMSCGGGNTPAPPGRVLLAWGIDRWIHLFITMLPGILLALWLESLTTGTFAWNVSRDVIRTSDVAMWPVSLVAFGVFWAAPGVILWLRRVSAGCVITGVWLEADRSVPLSRLAVTTIAKYFVRGFGFARADHRLRPGGFELRALRL